MRVLVTGGTGLVGSAIQSVVAEAAESHQLDLQLIYVGSKDVDLRRLESVKRLLEIHAPLDGIIHLAANVGGLFKNMQHPVEMMQDNLLMNTNVLIAAHDANINNVLSCLSTCIFPDNVNVNGNDILTADMLHDGPPHHSNEGYAYSKRMVEVLSRAYQRQHGRRYFCVVPTNIYGPNDNFNLEDAHVIPALIHKCWLSKAEGSPFVVAGDGSPLRQFVYSEDLAKCILWAYKEYQDISTPLIVCPPDAEISISCVVSRIVDAIEFRGSVVYDTSKPNGQAKKTAEAAICKYLPSFEWTSLDEGISKTCQWFVSSPNKRI